MAAKAHTSPPPSHRPRWRLASLCLPLSLLCFSCALLVGIASLRGQGPQHAASLPAGGRLLLAARLRLPSADDERDVAPEPSGPEVEGRRPALPSHGEFGSDSRSSAGRHEVQWHVREKETRARYDRLARDVAASLGLENHGQIGELTGTYLYSHPHTGLSGNARKTTHDALRQHRSVLWSVEQKGLRRVKRSLPFNDPKFPKQWHLRNTHTPGMDLNVTGVWERGVTGKGVVVAVVDDGVEHTLPDLQSNYCAEGSYDLTDGDQDPRPGTGDQESRHGTRCAGEIAAVANNSLCGVGAAYDSRVAGIRLLDGPLTDHMEATAFNTHYQLNHIYSCSWGPDDDGKTVDGPHVLGQSALQRGVVGGRRGFGTIFVVASGNGGRYQDNCNYDGYANSIYTITIGAVDENGGMPFYAEECAAMMGVTFSSGDVRQRSIVTCDITGGQGSGCTEGHTGTSAAAPLAAAILALALQARPCLTWRDAQHLIVYTSVMVDEYLSEWDENLAGFHHSHKYGFGVLNAWRLVNAAKVWETVPYLRSFTSELQTENKVIPPFPAVLSSSLHVSNLSVGDLVTLEHVALHVVISHELRGNLLIELTCPSGTTSTIATRRNLDRNKDYDWTFSTLRCWGEEASGTYTLQIQDVDGLVVHGMLNSWQLTLYGNSWTPQHIEQRKRVVARAMSGEFLNDSFSLPCDPGIEQPDSEPQFLDPNTLKILALLGCSASFWAMYYLLEVVVCYDPQGDTRSDAESGSSTRCTFAAVRQFLLLRCSRARSENHRDRHDQSEELIPLQLPLQSNGDHSLDAAADVCDVNSSGRRDGGEPDYSHFLDQVPLDERREQMPSDGTSDASPAPVVLNLLGLEVEPSESCAQLVASPRSTRRNSQGYTSVALEPPNP
ncbi:proprotein convertase subtilisin/kexin type 7 [Petromyzon marinus]|uniref:proprotein convertase subtilisin/kexin type 7 n=1 Tax=Petromyzon marinus TaxID=7757 RepID=UPI003F7103AD